MSMEGDELAKPPKIIYISSDDSCILNPHLYQALWRLKKFISVPRSAEP